MDAQEYAADQGIDLAEAIHRLELQNLAGNLNAALSLREQEIFAGLWIDHKPNFRVIVQFTRNNETRLRPYIAGTPLADITEVRTVSHSLEALKKAQEEVHQRLDKLQVIVDSEIDVEANQVRLYVLDQTSLADVKLPDAVDVVEVDELSTPAADIYAGLALSRCTSGFAVQQSGTRGITTAGHCRNDITYQGKQLPFKQEQYSSSYDVQWHTAPDFTVRARFQTGFSVRSVTATKDHGSQNVGDFVCKHGKTTGYTCGYITSRTFKPSYVPNASASFIRVHRDDVILVKTGDSGGPWFNGNTAYGITSGFIGDDGIYMAVNYVEILGVSVLTE